MGQTSLSVWFVCKLCRGSFGQVDAFIEHKKQKHFTQFQNTTSIVFEETEQGTLYPLITKNGDHQLTEEISEPLIKVEVNDDDPVGPFSLGIIDEPNLDLVEPKSELITYESEIKAEDENSFFGLKQPQQNPYVLLKRLTSDEIQRALLPQHQPTLFKCEQEIVVNSLEDPNSSDVERNTIDDKVFRKSTEIPPTPTIGISTEPVHQFECKLCSKQLESEAQLKIHVGICALYHKHRNRFCVTCNRKFCKRNYLKLHRLRFHGTEEERLSLYKFKCHVCPKQYQDSMDLRRHLETHKKKKPKNVTTSTSNPFKCSYPNCETEFRLNCFLTKHISTVHLGFRPFSCHFPNCNKKFKERGHLEVHLRIHTGERPFKCTFDNCNKAFTTSQNRSRHHQSVHCNL